MESYAAQIENGNDLDLGVLEKRQKCRQLIIKTVIIIA